MSDHEILFRSMACDVKVIVGSPWAAGLPSPEVAAADQRRFVEAFAHRLSRFEADSELTGLNEDPRREVPASPLLRAAIRAGIWAAEASDGLVDPTLTDAIEAAGYAQSKDRDLPLPLLDALGDAPPRHPARPDPARRWAEVQIDDAARVIRRPPGLRFDTGGTGKGLAADAVTARLGGYSRFAISCGGDLAVGGSDPAREPFSIDVRHPIDREVIEQIWLREGGVATSGLGWRIWRMPDGSVGHHLLDPATGRPAWTGLIGVTAIGGTCLEAETLSKQALLAGPDAARDVLAAQGGVLFHDDGSFELVGRLPVLREFEVRLRARE